MIRYKNALITLIRHQRTTINLVTVSKKAFYCTNNEKKELPPPPDQEEKFDPNQKRREERNDFFEKRALILKGAFELNETKTKSAYLQMIDIFLNKDVHRRNHVEFIYSALKNMEDYGVLRDLEVYKKLIDVMPKGKFIPRNLWQVEFQHYPKQQQCIIDVLNQMEDNGVIPDSEVENMLKNIFGRTGHPVRKYWRMMYWMPKFKNLSPWPVPNPPPNDALELAKLALERMCSVDLQSKIDIFNTNELEDSVDDTWIVSGQSPIQKELLEKHDKSKALFIEGPFNIWLRYKCITYFILRSEPPENFIEKNEDIEVDDVSDIEVPIFSLGKVKQKKNKLAIIRSVHEQKDGTIYAICCTGCSTKDSLLSWIRFLEKNGNPCLANLAILFKFRSTTERELIVASSEPTTTSSSET